MEEQNNQVGSAGRDVVERHGVVDIEEIVETTEEEVTSERKLPAEIPCCPTSFNRGQSCKLGNVVYFKKFNVDATIPSKNFPGAVGLSLSTVKDIDVFKGDVVSIETGLGYQPNADHYAMIESLHTTAAKGLIIIGGIIDSNFRGAIKVFATNAASAPLHLRKHDKFAQMLLLKQTSPKVFEVSHLDAEQPLSPIPIDLTQA